MTLPLLLESQIIGQFADLLMTAGLAFDTCLESCRVHALGQLTLQRQFPATCPYA